MDARRNAFVHRSGPSMHTYNLQVVIRIWGSDYNLEVGTSLR